MGSSELSGQACCPNSDVVFTTTITPVTTSTQSQSGCSTVSGVPCVFPFNWNGNTYTSCTTDGGFSTPWCSTQTDLFGNHVTGNYGDCSADCLTNAVTTTTASSSSSGCSTASGAACVFPFSFQGVTHSSCTTAGGFSSPWCSTLTDGAGNHITGNYGDCSAQCATESDCLTVAGPKPGLKCVFPFRYNGN